MAGGAARLVVRVAPLIICVSGFALLILLVPGKQVHADGSDGGGVRVEAEVPVTAMDRSVKPANNSPQLAAHPDDGELLASANRVDAPDFSCALHLSGDGGRSWVPADPVPELPEGAEKCYGPEVAFGPDGTLYYLFAGLSGEGNTPMGVFLTDSQDRGRTFSEPRQILGEHKFGVGMAIDHNAGGGGRLHFTWIDARSEVRTGGFGPPPNPIMAAYSDDGGETLSQPVQVNDPDRDFVVGPALAVGDDGKVQVAYFDLVDDQRDYFGLEGPTWEGQWEVVLASSADGGDSFEVGEVVGEVTPHERIMVIFTAAPPALAAGDDGRVCVAWSDAVHGDADALARCRPQEGQAWHDVVRINDDPKGSGETQKLPQLAIAPQGRIDAIFYDMRGHPDDLYTDVSYASSTDGGRTFGENQQLTSEHSFTRIGQQYPLPSAQGMVEFGGRLGLHARDDRFVAAWADTRNSRPPSHAQDVFAAVATRGSHKSGGGPSTAITVGGLLGVAALLTAGVIAARRRRQRMAVQEPTAGAERASTGEG